MDPIDRKDFAEAIYTIVRMIPVGRATSYGAIARAVGYSNLSRMVGKIMSESDSARNNIPAHRVVNSSGVLTAKRAFGPNDEMEKLLEEEGIRVSNDRIQNWKAVFWNPLDEIEL